MVVWAGCVSYSTYCMRQAGIAPGIASRLEINYGVSSCLCTSLFVFHLSLLYALCGFCRGLNISPTSAASLVDLLTRVKKACNWEGGTEMP
jgi:hypothetical protein